jgi:hypothetical protein
MMSKLTGLKLVAAKKQSQLSPVMQRRNKMVKRVAEQIALAQAKADGRELVATRQRVVRDASTGETKTVQVPKRQKAWWWATDSGKVCLTLRYGAKVIELAKGKNAIELDAESQVLATLQLVKDAVMAGELDGQLEVIGNSVRKTLLA